MITKQEYLRAKEAVIISAQIMQVLEDSEIDAVSRRRLEDCSLMLNEMFYHGYADYLDHFEPELHGLESGMRWEDFYGYDKETTKDL